MAARFGAAECRAIWVGVGAAKSANGWGQGVAIAASGGGADELDPDVSAAGGVDAGGGSVSVGGVDTLTCQRLIGMDCSLVRK